MSLQLPTAPPSYDTTNETLTRRKLDLADAQNLKRTQDVVGSRIIIQSPNGQPWQLVVDNTGAPGFVAVTL